MTRYALIDYSSGYVWGVADAETPEEACKLVDESVGHYGAEYTERSRYDAVQNGYFVHKAPEGFDVDDGQNEAAVAAVNAMPCVALIESRKGEF